MAFIGSCRYHGKAVCISTTISHTHGPIPSFPFPSRIVVPSWCTMASPGPGCQKIVLLGCDAMRSPAPPSRQSSESCTHQTPRENRMRMAGHRNRPCPPCLEEAKAHSHTCHRPSLGIDFFFVLGNARSSGPHPEFPAQFLSSLFCSQSSIERKKAPRT